MGAQHVVVIGGGVIGLTTAYQLAVDGAFGASAAGGDTAPGVSTPLTLAAIVALGVSGGLWFVRRRLAGR